MVFGTWRSRGASIVLITKSLVARYSVSACANVDFHSHGDQAISTHWCESLSMSITCSSRAYSSSHSFFTGLTMVNSCFALTGGSVYTILYDQIWYTSLCFLDISTNAAWSLCSVSWRSLTQRRADCTKVIISFFDRDWVFSWNVHHHGHHCFTRIGAHAKRCTDIVVSSNNQPSWFSNWWSQSCIPIFEDKNLVIVIICFLNARWI